MSGGGESVKVIVRCRPLNQREKDLNCNIVLSMDSGRGQCSIVNPSDRKAPSKNFFFDGSYFIDSTTEQIYADIAYPLVEGVSQGYNGTIFAYGQTGCGKSFTMQGITEPSTQRGIIPRAFDHIFETIALAENCKYLVHASYLEIYNEDIRDLLGKDAKAKLELKEHPDKGVYVAGLSMHKMTTVRECQIVMDRGWKNRSTGATLMNADSSRSHSIFTIYMEMADQASDEQHIRAGKLNLVDLAGSERQSKTGATGDRLKEATKINLSLSALGNVISSLVDGKSKHIPYRDSKLTRLLQDSLGGNTKTLMVACLSPADNNYEETLSTLRYANRAKNIQNKPKINEDPKDALLREYQEEIQRLKQMLAGQLPIQAVAGADFSPQSPSHRQNHHHQHNNDRSTSRSDQDPHQDEMTRRQLDMKKEKLREEYEMRLQEKEKQYQTEAADKARLMQDMKALRKHYDSKIETLDNRYRDAYRRDTAVSDREDNSRPAVEVVQEGGGGGGGRDAVRQKTGRLKPISDADAEEMTSFNGGAPIAAPVLIIDPDGDVVTTEEGRNAAIMESSKNAQQRAVHVTSKKSAAVEGQKMTPDQLLAKLRQLESGMVGGEQSHNREMKEKHIRRTRHVERYMKKMNEAKIDDDEEDEEVMRGIFENIHDELKAKNRQLKKERRKNEELQQEIQDLQTEFERDRTDYLDTIREQEKRLKLYQSIMEKMVGGVRRDCNYYNVDRIISQSKWNGEKEEWLVPALSIERSHLPSADPRHAQQPAYTHKHMSPGGGDDDEEVDRDGHNLFNRMSTRQDNSQEYFTNKRANKLLQSRGHVGEPVSPSRSAMHYPQPEQQYPDSYYDPPSSPIYNSRPQRLHAMDGASAGRRGRKKRNSPRDDY